MVHLSPKKQGALFLALVILIATYPLLLGRFYAIGDMHDVFLPLEDFYQHELKAGRLPLWQPDAAWGFPALASAQIGFFYPPLLLGRLLPLFIYMPLILVLHLFTLAWGMYTFARHNKISHAGALFCALSLTLSSFVWQHLTHFNIILNLIWLPWQFLCFKRLAENPTSTKNKVWVTLVLAAPFLAGHLHLSFLMVLMSGAYYFSLQPRKIYRASLRLIPILLLVGALAAPQILPTLELASQSTRATGSNFDLERANQHSWPLYHLPTLIFPRFFGVDSTYWGKRLEVEYGIFLGTLPLILGLWATRPAWKSHRFFVIAAAGGFLLALGDMSPIRIIGLEPTFWYFTAPARWLLLYTFAMSFMSGIGLDMLATRASELRRVTVWIGSIVLTCVVLWNVVIWSLPTTAPQEITAFLNEHHWLGERPLSYYEHKLTALVVSLRSTTVSGTAWATWLPLIILALTPAMVRHRHAKYLLTGATAIELLCIAATTIPTLPWSTLTSPPATLQELPANIREGQARLLSVAWVGDTGRWLSNPDSRPDDKERERRRQLLIPLTNTRFSIAGPQWPASLDLDTQYKALKKLERDEGIYLSNSTIAEELNVGAIIINTNVEHQIDNFQRQKTIGDIIVYELQPQPRAALVTTTTTTPLPYEPITPTKLHWQVNATEPARLIVRDTFYPGWQATIDGQSVSIERFDELFRQVAIPEGEHTIEMMYRPVTVYTGIGIAAVASVILLGLALRPTPLPANDTLYHHSSPVR